MTATHERQGHALIEPIVRDEVVRFGPEGQLVGIVSHPPGGRASASAHAAPASTSTAPASAALLLLNAGVLHRVGPHRLHVELARRCAAQGVPSLRLDLGGIGDSLASTDAPTFRESAVADTREAMTGLTGVVGARKFVLFGICAGADNSLATALVDDRVAGIVLVDPAVYTTRRSQLRHIRNRVLEKGGPREVLRWGLAAAERRVRAEIERRRRPESADEEEAKSQGREPPPFAEYRNWLVSLADRGVGVLCIYSGIHGPRYNDPDQLFELIPELRGRVDRAYFPMANHTFTELAAQAELLDAVTRWVHARATRVAGA